MSGCAGPRPPHAGPIVLITIDALRADVIGALGGDPALTPNLDRFAAESDWAEPAVSASSWTVPSMASIMTGLQPWSHGSWHAGRAVLDERLQSLAEALHDLGYRTTAFRSNTWLREKFGYRQGFDDFFDLGRLRRAEVLLRDLDGSRDFVWVHILPPHAPYLFRAEFASQVADVPDDPPKRVQAADLEPYYDPSVELPAQERARLWALYRFNVAYADQLVGRLLACLRESGQWGNAVVAVTSDHGEEFGEGGQIAHGGNLTRVLVEVPLFLKLPHGLLPRRGVLPRARQTLTPRRWVANARLTPTLIELAGGQAAEGTLPSLFDADERVDERGALSELYLGNGVNTFSLVVDGRQLVWQAAFAAPAPDYYRARRATFSADPGDAEAKAAEELFGRMAEAFLIAPPLSGSGHGTPRLEMIEWSASGAVDGPGTPDGTPDDGRVDSETRALARLLEAAWTADNGPQLAPLVLEKRGHIGLTAEERAQLRSLGYVVE